MKFRSGERLNDDGTVNVMTAVAGQIKDVEPKKWGQAPGADFEMMTFSTFWQDMEFASWRNLRFVLYAMQKVWYNSRL